MIVLNGVCAPSTSHVRCPAKKPSTVSAVIASGSSGVSAKKCSSISARPHPFIPPHLLSPLLHPERFRGRPGRVEAVYPPQRLVRDPVEPALTAPHDPLETGPDPVETVLLLLPGAVQPARPRLRRRRHQTGPVELTRVFACQVARPSDLAHPSRFVFRPRWVLHRLPAYLALLGGSSMVLIENTRPHVVVSVFVSVDRPSSSFSPVFLLPG